MILCVSNFAGGESGCLTSGIITCKIFWINCGSGNFSNFAGFNELPLNRYTCVVLLLVLSNKVSFMANLY